MDWIQRVADANRGHLAKTVRRGGLQQPEGLQASGRSQAGVAESEGEETGSGSRSSAAHSASRASSRHDEPNGIADVSADGVSTVGGAADESQHGDGEEMASADTAMQEEHMADAEVLPHTAPVAN